MLERETIIFLLPLNVQALAGGPVNPYSNSDISTDSETSWDRRQLYMNPQSFQIRDQKLIQKQLTKGGHMVQYWGEDLTVIDVQGTTGSSGIEGINILRDIYRHEQLHYKNVLADRQRELARAAALSQAEAEKEIYEGNFGGFLVGAADALTGGAVTKTVDGISNTIDIMFGTGLGDNFGGTGGSFSAVPTLASFATNIDMYYQGEFFRGYFTSFSTTESANEPGHFTYNFNFVVTRRSGKRTNFMPWHRSPLSLDGEAVKAQHRESKGTFPGTETLSYPSDNPGWSRFPPGGPFRDFDDEDEGVTEEFPREPNSQPDRASLLGQDDK